MLTDQGSTYTITATSSAHPALTYRRFARLKSAPKRHVQLEAVELARVVHAARAQLDETNAWHVLDRLDALDHHELLAVGLYATGQALRVPVVVRGGLDDSKGRDAPGNGLSHVLAALAGRRRAYSAETTRQACVVGDEAGMLARGVRMQNGQWTDAQGNSWRRKFMRGLLYVSAETLQTLYLAQEWHELVAALGRALPAAWRRAAALRRKSGGYWHAIRPEPKRPKPAAVVPFKVIASKIGEGQTFKQIATTHPGLSYDRIRAVYRWIMKKLGISKTKGDQIPEGTTSGASAPSAMPGAGSAGGPDPCPSAARTAAQKAGPGGATDDGGRSCQTLPLHSTAAPVERPSQALRSRLGADHPLVRDFGG